MAYNSGTDAQKVFKEILDAKIHASFENNTQVLKAFKRTVGSEEINGRGRAFTMLVQDNESYGSMTTEGGAFPVAVDMVDVKPVINYRSQFASFDFTGDVEDLRNTKTLQDLVTRIMENTTKAFDEKQEFFLFGSGNGAIATASASNSSGTQAFAKAVGTGLGANFVRKGQLLSIMDASNSFADLGDHTVTSVNRSTDVVTFGETVASDAPDILTFRDSYNYAPLGFKYHINSGDSNWLGVDRTTYTSLAGVIVDAASASIDFDLIEDALLLSRNARGDMAPKFDYTFIMHPAQHKNLRQLARDSGNVQFNAKLNGNEKADLLIRDIGLGGASIMESSWCDPSDVWGLRMEDWMLEEVVPRQLYKHGSGDIFIQQIASATTYGDAKEGRVYWRYNPVCKAPHSNFRLKNINFASADIKIQRV